MFLSISSLWNILSAISNILSAMQIEYCQKSSLASKKSRWTLKDEYVNILSAGRLLCIYIYIIYICISSTLAYLVITQVASTRSLISLRESERVANLIIIRFPLGLGYTK